MWALVENNSVTSVLNSFSSTMTIGSRNYDKKELNNMSDSGKLAIGIYPVTVASRFDENYYINHDATYAVSGNTVVETITKAADKKLTDTDEVDENSDPVLDNEGVQVVTLGLKSNAKNQATAQANGYLQGFDWLIQRKVTANTAIPSAVTTYMAAIRTDHGNICTALDGAANMAAFIALHTTTYKADKTTVDVIAKTQSWTSDANVRQFRR